MTYREVSKDDFYNEISSRKLDVHPRCEREVVTWEFRNTRKIFGKNTPGYSLSGYPNIKKQYYIYAGE